MKAVAALRAIVAVARRAIVAAALGLACAGASLAVDANTATQDELQTVRGVGPALSARIVEARRAKPFADLEDLKARVRGIGDANLRRMREAGLRVGPSGRVDQVQTFVGQPAADGARRGRSAPGTSPARKSSASISPAPNSLAGQLPAATRR